MIGLEKPPSIKLATLAVIIVMIAAFGPYTPLLGARTEQLAVYGCLVLALPFCITRIRLSGDSKGFLWIWSAFVMVGLLGVISPVPAPYEPGKFLGGADNLMRPAAVLLLGSMWLVNGADRESLLRLACRILVGAMIVNALLGIIQSQVDMSSWLSLFWSSAVDDVANGTTAGRSAQLGRFTGILNQPAEAGMLYGMALFAALYLWRRRPAILAPTFCLLLVGGALTVSKIFLLVALPIAVWQLVTEGDGRVKRLILVSLAVLAVAGAAANGLTARWTGSDRLLSLTSPDGSFLSFYSAGRFGPGATLSEVVNLVLSASPLVGFGLRGLVVAYDNGWVQALVFAGLIGAAAYTAALAILVRAWWKRRRQANPGESALAGGLVLLTIVASAGFPTLTGNRVATVLWVLLTLTILSCRVPISRATRPGQAEGPAPGATP